MEEEHLIDLFIKGLDRIVSFVQGRRNYVPEHIQKPDSSQIIETNPKEHTAFISDKENNINPIHIPTPLFNRIQDLKKTHEADLITQKQFEESRQKILDDYSEYFSNYKSEN